MLFGRHAPLKNQVIAMLFQKLLAILSFVYVALATGRALIIFDSENVDLEDAPLDLQRIFAFLKANNIETALRGYKDLDYNFFVGDTKPLINNLFLLPVKSKKIANKDQLNKVNLVKLLNNNVNIVVAGDSDVSYPDDIREFLNEVGIYPSPKGYKLIDHFQEDDKVKLTDESLGCSKILSTIDSSYDGQSAIISNNQHLLPILKASATSFSSNDKINPIDNDNTWGIGEQSFIGVGLQSLAGARLTWFGATEFLTEEVLGWSIGKRNILKLQFVHHFKVDEPQNINGTLYRIKDQVVYTIGVSELVDNQWKPFIVKDEDDTLQLSFKMLDPYQRLNLQPLGPVASQENGNLDTYAYTVNFTIPDHHGIFTFELDYKRAGLSYLLDKKIVSVRHLANDEFKRSWNITNSWLYIASAILVVAGWMVFIVNFIYVSNDDIEKKNL